MLYGVRQFVSSQSVSQQFSQSVTSK